MSERIHPTSAICPVARFLDAIGDRWSLLIVRDAFDGSRRFGDFQRELGVARNILTDRLRRLVDAGVLELQPASDGSSYQEYVLTAAGEQLFPVVVAMRQWGEKTCSSVASAARGWSIRKPESPFPTWRPWRATAAYCPPLARKSGARGEAVQPSSRRMLA